MSRALRLAERRRGGGRPRRAGTGAPGRRLDTAPHRDHLPAAGIAPRSARPRARPPAAHHAQARPPGLDDIDDDLSRSCGGDMSTPQKCPPARHYLQTTSDNRRYGRVTLRPVYRRLPHRTGLFVRSGQAEIRTQLLCSSAASDEPERSGVEWSGNQRDSVPRPPRRAAHRRPGPGQRQRHSPRCASFPIPRQYPPGQPTLYRVLPRSGSPERSAARLPSCPAGNI